MALIVNGEKIDDRMIQQEVNRLRPHYEQAFADKDPKEREAQLLDWSRENVIERVLLSQEAKKRGDKIAEAEVQSVLAKLREQYEDWQELYKNFDVEDEKEVRQAIELQMRVERELNAVCEDLPKPSQADIEQYYQENREQFESDEQLRVAHIVKYVNWQTDEATAFEAIKKAHDELKNGAAFEMVVDKYTECADMGGDLGYVVKGQMVEEFEDVVFNLGIGQVSDIFRTRFGFHIAKVYDRKPGTVPSLKEVKGQVVDELKEQMRQKAIEQYLDQLRETAKIEEV
jgi:parvulin-like peptidyl-prolyl isomerase